MHVKSINITLKCLSACAPLATCARMLWRLHMISRALLAGHALYQVHMSATCTRRTPGALTASSSLWANLNAATLPSFQRGVVRAIAGTVAAGLRVQEEQRTASDARRALELSALQVTSTTRHALQAQSNGNAYTM
jgi:hypothetical protein